MVVIFYPNCKPANSQICVFIQDASCTLDVGPVLFTENRVLYPAEYYDVGLLVCALLNCSLSEYNENYQPIYQDVISSGATSIAAHFIDWSWWVPYYTIANVHQAVRQGRSST